MQATPTDHELYVTSAEDTIPDTITVKMNLEALRLRLDEHERRRVAPAKASVARSITIGSDDDERLLDDDHYEADGFTVLPGLDGKYEDEDEAPASPILPGRQPARAEDGAQRLQKASVNPAKYYPAYDSLRKEVGTRLAERRGKFPSAPQLDVEVFDAALGHLLQDMSVRLFGAKKTTNATRQLVSEDRSAQRESKKLASLRESAMADVAAKLLELRRVDEDSGGTECRKRRRPESGGAKLAAGRFSQLVNAVSFAFVLTEVAEKRRCSGPGRKLRRGQPVYLCGVRDSDTAALDCYYVSVAPGALRKDLYPRQLELFYHFCHFDSRWPVLISRWYDSLLPTIASKEAAGDALVGRALGEDCVDTLGTIVTEFLELRHLVLNVVLHQPPVPPHL